MTLIPINNLYIITITKKIVNKIYLPYKIMDITSIPLDDAIYFLESNKQRVPQTQDEIYTATWDLIMSGRAQTSPPAVADWIIAYNLQDSDIPPLKTSYILTAPDANLYDLTDIFQLGEVDKERIIRILGFLNALENDI